MAMTTAELKEQVANYLEQGEDVVDEIGGIIYAVRFRGNTCEYALGMSVEEAVRIFKHTQTPLNSAIFVYDIAGTLGVEVQTDPRTGSAVVCGVFRNSEGTDIDFVPLEGVYVYNY